MRVYYEIMVWEEIDEYDTEKLKGKFAEFGKRLQGFGIVSFNMKSSPQLTPEQQQQLQQQQAQAQELEQQQISEADEEGELEQEVVEE